jgi:hypothetical protein
MSRSSFFGPEPPEDFRPQRSARGIVASWCESEHRWKLLAEANWSSGISLLDEAPLVWTGSVERIMSLDASIAKQNNSDHDLSIGQKAAQSREKARAVRCLDALKREVSEFTTLVGELVIQYGTVSMALTKLSRDFGYERLVRRSKVETTAFFELCKLEPELHLQTRLKTLLTNYSIPSQSMWTNAIDGYGFYPRAGLVHRDEEHYNAMFLFQGSIVHVVPIKDLKAGDEIVAKPFRRPLLSCKEMIHRWDQSEQLLLPTMVRLEGQDRIDLFRRLQTVAGLMDTAPQGSRLYQQAVERMWREVKNRPARAIPFALYIMRLVAKHGFLALGVRPEWDMFASLPELWPHAELRQEILLRMLHCVWYIWTVPHEPPPTFQEYQKTKSTIVDLGNMNSPVMLSTSGMDDITKKQRDFLSRMISIGANVMSTEVLLRGLDTEPSANWLRRFFFGPTGLTEFNRPVYEDYARLGAIVAAAFGDLSTRQSRR